MQVMVMGPYANGKAECFFRDAAALLDSKMEAAGSEGRRRRRWEYVRVGCEDASYLGKRHWSPAGAGQFLRAHRSTFNSFFNNKQFFGHAFSNGSQSFSSGYRQITIHPNGSA